MKIVIIIGDITKTGGTERATINVSNLLCESHNVVIFSLGMTGTPFFKVDNRVSLRFLGLGEIPTSIAKKVKWFSNLYNVLKVNLQVYLPDVIVGQGHNINSILPFVKTKQSSVFACEHIDYASIPFVSRSLMKISYPKLTGLIVLSQIAKKKLQKLNSNIFIIPNSIPFTVEKTAELTNPKMIMVGRISTEKGYERLVPIAKKLQEEFPDWMIDIFGNGPLKSEIEKSYTTAGLNNITINDPVRDIGNKYLDSSIHLITSYNEAMPMVILEAQYCGLPVVGFRCEGTESLVNDGINGFIVDSHEDFYEKLKILILERKKRLEMGLQGRQATKIYDSKHIKLQWENIVSDLQQKY